jgi:hypothetical protein
LLLPLVLLLSTQALGADTPSVFGRGRMWLGLSSGYSYSLRTGNTDVAHVEYVPVYPRVGVSVTDPLGGEAWYRGAIDLMFEGTFLVEVEPHGGFAGGASLGARYNFLAPAPLVPFVEIGLGIVNMELNLEELSDGVGFPFYAGVGSHVFLSDRLAITPQWRFHHLSNGGTGGANRGLNDSVVLVGVTFFLD